MKIIHSRIQHGVGQGSFHSASVEVTDVGGVLYRFDYVYDCGALVGKVASSQLVRCIKRIDLCPRVDSGGKAVIDALILSHFDRDHIIGAALLVNKFMVRRIYVPYITPIELAFVLAGLELQLEASYIRELHGLATGTGTLFGVPATMVQPAGDGNNSEPPQNSDGPSPIRDEAVAPEEDRLPTSLQAIVGQTGKPTGKVLTARQDVGLGAPGLPRFSPWKLRFWNRGLDGNLITHLLNELGLCKFPLDALSNANSADELVNWLEDSANRVATLKAYRNAITAYKPAWRAEASVRRLANLLSLCMYSGPEADNFNVRGYKLLESTISDRRYEYKYWSKEEQIRRLLTGENRVGWLGTGDAPLGESSIWADFSAHYQAELDRVLTVQVPHHGAAPIGGPKFFNPALIQSPGMNAVISVGTKNSYGHPRASVLKAVLAEGACLEIVTEECWLGFHEVIDLDIP
jgi:beta-lactamase superfamily II metal-dependent hydrolase